MTTRRGPTERAARRFVKALGELQGAQATLAEACYLVARALDEREGRPDMATAANLRELRSTLDALERRGDSDTGDAFVASLFTEVGDGQERGAADPRHRGRQDRGGAGHPPDAVAAARRQRGAGDRR
jgi:phytoene/squalene synthetase